MAPLLEELRKLQQELADSQYEVQAVKDMLNKTEKMVEAKNAEIH